MDLYKLQFLSTEELIDIIEKSKNENRELKDLIEEMHCEIEDLKDWGD